MEEIQPAKKPWQSRTYWIALANAVFAFFPFFQKLVVEHPQAYLIGLSAVFAALRKVTKGKVDII